MLLSADALAHQLTYYYQDSGSNLLVFSTELKAVLAHPAVPRQLNEGLLPLYLSEGFTPAPFTLAQGVRKVQPAECLSFAPKQTKAKRFWRLALEPGPNDFEHWVQRTRSEVAESVRRTLGGAQNVAIYLSGGVESSVVLAALAETGGVNRRAFMLAFKDHSSEYDLAWAKRVAEATGTSHQTVVVDVETQVTPALLSRLLGQIDEPFDSAGRVVNEFFLGEAALAAGFTSALNGGPGEPLFGFEQAHKLQAKGGGFQTFEEAVSDGFETHTAFNEKRLNKALTKPVDLAAIREASLANRAMVSGLGVHDAVMFAWFLHGGASRYTVFAQYIPPLMGIDERPLFLDCRLASLGLSIPAGLRGIDSMENDRAVLKPSFRESLQVDFGLREKRAFPNPPQPAWLNRMLLPGLSPLVEDGIIRPEYLGKLKEDFCLGKKRARKAAWSWFVLSCWYQSQIKQTDPFSDAY